jgi:hypothetical protein
MKNETDILCANLEHLQRTEPQLAERLRQVAPASLQWAESRAGPLYASIENNGRPLLLASKYDPAAEAEKLNSTIDRTRHAGIFMLGMGLGYHIAQIARTLGDTSIMVVYEPDLSLMRAVFERIDHTAWLGQHNIILGDDTMDRAALTVRVEKFGGIITQGTVLVTHPPSRQMHGEAFTQFGEIVAEVLAFCRTTVATTLVNMARTVHNLSMNLSHYAAGANTNELYRAAQGCPAVCVGAGPSLARNVELLSDPDVRKNVIVISAQTTLKLLLDRGIRPDFVTALDYHEISRRFYEGLPELPDVTLIAEAKAHESVLDNYPGPVRVTQSKFLDKLLGDLVRPIVPIKAGATVAHLSVYLAQHMGCDPIILIGQDLGFSDGLYYSPGTAIDDVWAPELGQFNTVEMMQWQRIVRHRGSIERAEDIHGRPIFTDEQMLTYLKQFERDFLNATQTIINATEGGMSIEHTQPMTLAAALQQYAVRAIPDLPCASQGFNAQRLEQVEDLLQRRLENVSEMHRLASDTVQLLKRMKRHQRDKKKCDKLFKQIDRNKVRVDALGDTFDLINQLNAIGSFKRARSDRVLENAPKDDPFEHQKRVIERDLENIDWLIQACDEAKQTFTLALTRLNIKPQKEQLAVA